MNRLGKRRLNLYQLEIQSMVIPGIVALTLFSYWPMYGVIIAFKRYNILSGIGASPWVGFQNFVSFFRDPQFWNVMRNTVGIRLLGLFLAWPVPIIFALLLNELLNHRFKRFTQTISYLPHFISWVLFGGLTLRFLSLDNGVINNALQGLGIIREPIFFMGTPSYFWWIIIYTGLIKEMGWQSIIYLSAIAGVNPELYESAVVDGAGRFRQMWSITLPSIMGTVAILLIFQVAKMLLLDDIFAQVYVLQNSLNLSRSEVIVTYVYKVGIQQARFSYAAAVGLFTNLISMSLLIIANFVSRRATGHGLY